MRLPWNSVLARERQIVAIARFITTQQVEHALLFGDFNARKRPACTAFWWSINLCATANAHPYGWIWPKIIPGCTAFALHRRRIASATRAGMAKNTFYAPVTTERIYLADSGKPAPCHGVPAGHADRPADWALPQRSLRLLTDLALSGTAGRFIPKEAISRIFFFRFLRNSLQKTGAAQVCSVCAMPTEAGEQGYSGAKLMHLVYLCADGREHSLLTKYADSRERAVMDVLTRRVRGCTPVFFVPPFR